jgi:hypothetical protein
LNIRLIVGITKSLQPCIVPGVCINQTDEGLTNEFSELKQMGPAASEFELKTKRNSSPSGGSSELL